MYSVVLLDFDGTLCNSHDANLFCLCEVFEQCNLPIPDADHMLTRFATGQPIQGTIQDLLNHYAITSMTSTEILAIYRRQYVDFALSRGTLYPKVAETLAQLSQVAECVIVSNHHEKTLRLLIDHYKLGDYIKHSMGQAPGVVLKPDPWFYTHKVSALYPSHKPSDFLMVGDTLADIQFAQTCGIPVAWASYGYGQLSSQQESSVDYVIKAPIDLLPILNA